METCVYADWIGLLEPEMLTDPETLKMVTSSFDPKKGTVQAATGSINGISVHESADHASRPMVARTILEGRSS